MPGLNKCVSSLTFDNKGNLYAGVFTGDSRKEARNGNVYKCLAGEKAFKPMWGIKDGDGVISLIYEENKNILYARLPEMEETKWMLEMVPLWI